MNFINKVNKYLLEHYPLIWNMRLVWIVGVNILVHVLFFVIGFTAVNDLEDLKEYYNLSSYFFESSAVYYNFLISIVIILVWVIYYLRNNAFKNLYSLPKLFLFKQFCIMLFIFFISISQYFSFRQGLVTKIRANYDWEEIDSDIKNFNRTAIFFPQEQSNYTINNKKYPQPFPLEMVYSDDLKIESEDNYYDDNLNSFNIDRTKPYIVKNKLFYQFFKFNEELWLTDNEINPDINRIGRNDFKYRIVKDISAFKHLIKPSLLNYSKELFVTGQDSLAYESQINFQRNILENADESEIEKALNTFLVLAEKYKISHNLDIETWFNLTINQPNYFLKLLINKSPPDIYNNYSDTKSRYYDDVPYSEKLYLSLGNTDHIFENIYEAYFISSNVAFIQFVLGLAYFLSLIFFIFKTTSIKNVLLSIVAGIIILIIIVWLMTSISYASSDTDLRIYTIMSFITFGIIVFSIIGYLSKWKKIGVHILWSLGLFAFPLFILFSCLNYIKNLRNAHLAIYPKEYSYTSDFEIWFGNYGFWLVILSAFTAVYIYSVFITKLKARPE